ncbi:MAG: plasmid pRiA4b ORF-3 family protein, partial [Acidobacteria bacterium]|nr:plasmid pRiA4b ORF-3 family protein [Acidobacteriota bacterium]
SLKAADSNAPPETAKRLMIEHQHTIVYEGEEPIEEAAPYPRCIGGARRCPPEDCGGMHGYVEFLAAINDPSHSAHAAIERHSPSRRSSAFHRSHRTRQGQPARALIARGCAARARAARRDTPAAARRA